MRKTYVFRAYPTVEQEQLWMRCLRVTREVWNAANEERIWAYKKAALMDKNDPERKKVYPSVFSQYPQIKEIRKFSPELNDAPSACLREVLQKLDIAWKNFARRHAEGVRPPGFAKARFWNTLSIWQPSSLALDNDVLDFGKIKGIQLFRHRVPQGRLRSADLKKVGRHWYAHLSYDEVSVRVQAPTTRAVGVDVGTMTYATTSAGTKIENPRWVKNSEKLLRRLQKKLSRQKKGSERRKETVRKIGKLHLKLTRQKDHFFNKTAYRLNVRYGLIGIEDLDLAEMRKRVPYEKKRKRTMRKNVTKASWGKLFDKIEEKAEEMGRTAVRVPARGTSQECSSCGQVVKKDLSVRVHQCPCGLTLDRDENAARNILARAKTICNGSALSGQAVSNRDEAQSGEVGRSSPLASGASTSVCAPGGKVVGARISSDGGPVGGPRNGKSLEGGTLGKKGRKRAVFRRAKKEVRADPTATPRKPTPCGGGGSSG